MILFALMAVDDIHDENIGLLGLPYIVKQALGNTVGNIFLIDAAIAITVCCLAVHTSCIRMMFAMARDNRLPFGPQVARVSGRGKVPIVPALVVGVPRDRAAGDQHRQPERVPGPDVGGDHHVLPRLPVRHRAAAPAPHPRDVADARARAVLLARALGHCSSTCSPWSTARSWPSTSRGRARTSTTRSAPTTGTSSTAAYLFIGGVALVGAIYYFAVYSRKPIEVVAEHSPSTTCRSSRSPKWRRDLRGGVRLRHRRRRDRRLRGRRAAVRGPQRDGLPARGRPVGRRRPRDPAPGGLDVPPGLRLRLGLPGRAAGEGQQLPAPRAREGARRLLVAQLVHRLLDAARGPRRVGGDGLRGLERRRVLAAHHAPGDQRRARRPPRAHGPGQHPHGPAGRPVRRGRPRGRGPGGPADVAVQRRAHGDQRRGLVPDQRERRQHADVVVARLSASDHRQPPEPDDPHPRVGQPGRPRRPAPRHGRRVPHARPRHARGRVGAARGHRRRRARSTRPSC